MKYMYNIIIASFLVCFSFSSRAQIRNGDNIKNAFLINLTTKSFPLTSKRTHLINLHLDKLEPTFKLYPNNNDLGLLILMNFYYDPELFNDRTYSDRILVREALNGIFAVPEDPANLYLSY